MQNVHTCSSHIDNTHYSIHIGTVTVNQAAFGMNDLGYRFNVFFKKAQRIGIGQHQANHSVITYRFECIQVNIAPLVGRNLDDAEAAHGAGGGGGARRAAHRGLPPTFWRLLTVSATHRLPESIASP